MGGTPDPFGQESGALGPQPSDLVGGIHLGSSRAGVRRFGVDRLAHEVHRPRGGGGEAARELRAPSVPPPGLRPGPDFESASWRVPPVFSCHGA